MLRWGRAGYFEKYFLHPVPERERVGHFFFKKISRAEAGLFFLIYLEMTKKGAGNPSTN